MLTKANAIEDEGQGDIFKRRIQIPGIKIQHCIPATIFWTAPSCVQVKSSHLLHLLLLARCAFSFEKFPVLVSDKFGFCLAS